MAEVASEHDCQGLCLYCIAGVETTNWDSIWTLKAVPEFFKESLQRTHSLGLKPLHIDFCQQHVSLHDSICPFGGDLDSLPVWIGNAPSERKTFESQKLAWNPIGG